MEQNSTPEFNGECAFAVSTGKRNVPGSPNHSLVDDGRTYYFKNGAARFLWKLLPNRAGKAAAVWTEAAPG